MNKAFSLVELSIVLIIIGLLVAGVSSGAKLIKQAKLNKVITELTEAKASIKTFQLTYDQLPGDFDGATDFWGTYNSSSNPTGTINGNDDGQIIYSTEGLRFWHHLSLAGVYSGGFTSGESAWVIGSSIPESSYGGAVYGIYYQTLNTEPGNRIRFGTIVSGTSNNAGIVSAASAYKVDKKMDDGDPSKGDVRANAHLYSNSASKPNGTICVNGAFTETDLSYVLTSTGASCVMDYDFN